MSRSMQRTPDHVHSFLFCLDFDRTLSDESRVDSAMTRACLDSGIDVNALVLTKRMAEARGGSFSTLEFLEQRYSLSIVDQVKRQFIATALRDGILYDDAMPFLRRLSEQAIPYCILTQGSENWQRIKLQAAGLDTKPVRIIDQSDKGREIRTWQTGTGRYEAPVLPGLSVERIALVDDKAKSFASLPPDCRGYLLRRPGQPILPSQRGTNPPTVTVITSLEALPLDVQ